MAGRYFCEDLDGGYLLHQDCGRIPGVLTGVQECYTDFMSDIDALSEEDLFAYEQSACTWVFIY